MGFVLCEHFGGSFFKQGKIYKIDINGNVMTECGELEVHISTLLHGRTFKFTILHDCRVIRAMYDLEEG